MLDKQATVAVLDLNDMHEAARRSFESVVGDTAGRQASPAYSVPAQATLDFSPSGKQLLLNTGVPGQPTVVWDWPTNSVKVLSIVTQGAQIYADNRVVGYFTPTMPSDVIRLGFHDLDSESTQAQSPRAVVLRDVLASGNQVFVARGSPSPQGGLPDLRAALIIPDAVNRSRCAAISRQQGYSRQAVALGCEMAGLVALSRGGVKSFIVWMLIGASFHKSAVVLLPIAALAGARNRLWTLLSGAAAAGVGFVLFLQKDAEDLYQNYVGAEYQSSGAAIQIAMNLVPATLVLLFGKRMQFPEGQGRIWFWFSVISFLLAGLLVVSPSSTAVDRIALYMLPLQLAGFAYLPNILPKKTISLLAIGPILFYYAAVQFVWLNFAVNAIMWLPYRFSLFRI